MKKRLAIVLSVFAIASTAVPIYATDVAYNDAPASTVSLYTSAESKTSFAAQMDKIPVELAARQNVTERDIDALLGEASIKQGAEREAIFDQLAEYGIYEYKGEVLERPTPLSESKDVDLTAPIIAYDSLNKTWSVACGGAWNNDEYLSERSFSGDVGGPDAFGVGYTGTQGYNSSVVRVSGSLRNGEDGGDYKSEVTYNRSDGDGSKGFGFRMQDYIYSLGSIDYAYMGKEWYALCVYDSNFMNFSGVATGYYIHTYDSCEISSVTFGLNGNIAGISIGVTDEAHHFKAFSSDTRFDGV